MENMFTVRYPLEHLLVFKLFQAYSAVSVLVVLLVKRNLLQHPHVVVYNVIDLVSSQSIWLVIVEVLPATNPSLFELDHDDGYDHCDKEEGCDTQWDTQDNHCFHVVKSLEEVLMVSLQLHEPVGAHNCTEKEAKHRK